MQLGFQLLQKGRRHPVKEKRYEIMETTTTRVRWCSYSSHGNDNCSCWYGDSHNNGVKTTRGGIVLLRNSRTRNLYSHIVPIIFLFLLTFTQGQGQGQDDRLTWNIEEEVDPGTLVGTLPVRPGLTYRFAQHQDNLQQYFTLDANSGEIRTAGRLDREALPTDNFDLFVQSTPPRHLIELRIAVRDINDNKPTFARSVLDISFSETDQPGTQVILDTATDPDVGINDVTTQYNIISGNERGDFRLVLLEASKPLLYLENTRDLDREQKDSYHLNISAQDGASPPKFGYLLVNITVTDFNDHPPLFDQSDYFTSVNETSPAGTSIIKVSATDLDTGTNADITYSIVNDDFNQFGIEAKTGVVKTLKKLYCYRDCNQEGEVIQNCKPKSCVVTVEARDSGRPFPLTGRAYITVTLIDENDHDPTITFLYAGSSKPYATVNEGAKDGSVVAIVSVTDKDEGVNGQTTVQIIKGNDFGHFALDPEGILRVAGKLDRERMAKYNLTMQARDMGVPQRTATAYLVIMVNDVNDHQPQFQFSRYNAELGELAPIGSFVASITATDNDTGINALVTYSIVAGDELGWFHIDENTGLVTTAQRLDHELRPVVTLRIQAQDGASIPYQAHANLTVMILDENDEIPTFEKEVFQVTLREGAGSGTEVITATALDRDKGLNGTVRYSLDSEVSAQYPGMFQLNEVTGRITLRRTLDREEHAQYDIIVRARDQGTPAQTSTATIHLNVSDVNDNAPVFYPVHYLIRVPETEPTHTSVIQVKAIDRDADSNAVVHYSIQDGAEGKFAINIETGWITLTDPLVHAQRDFYRITVSAQDEPGRVAVQPATVEIYVTDGSESAPQFNTPNGYSFSVTEGSTNRNVGIISASSSGSTASFTYAIIEGDENGVFTINPTSGRIQAVRTLDREEHAEYHLIVAAKASGMFAQTTVDITVLDINDNMPQFVTSTAEVDVYENWPIGHDVYLASATDPDSGDNAVITYAIGPGSSALFSVDPNTGMVRVAQALDISQQTYALSVIARAGGSSNIGATTGSSSTLQLTVHLIDVNDHTPTFDSKTYEVSVIESLPKNDRFYRVTATDGDLGANGAVFYEILNGNTNGQFGIFPDGVLYIARSLDRETQDMFALTIRAQDQGEPIRSATATVYIYILDANDNPPVFKNSTYNMHISEGSPIDTFVGVVMATDSDSGQNAELWYKFDNENNNFKIDPATGIIRTKKTFDREQMLRDSNQDTFSVVVIATDFGGAMALSSSAVVEVKVTDVNDNSPKFVRDIYEPSLFENAEVNTQVVKVSAMDEDSGVNSDVTYSFVEGNEEGKFTIDATSGQIILVEPLDREIEDMYELLVSATDGGELALNSTALVKITVMDYNDNKPVFSTTSLNTVHSIPENRPPGTYVFSIHTSDADRGNNAQVEYEITDGNVGHAFNIDRATGKIYVASELDFETRNRYELTIVAVDYGSPRLSSTMTSTINIEDMNDNAPTFTTSSIVRQVLENSGVGTIVGTVTATDVDKGENGELRYSISHQEPAGLHFTIDEVTGRITTAAEIDHEFSESFQLTIVATDQAEPFHSVEKVITVVVKDVNDNPPQFTSMSAIAIPDDSSVNSIIGKIEARDPDEGANGRVRYELINGPSTFSLDSNTGDLTLRESLSGRNRVYDLTVRATDQGSQRRMATTKVTVFTVSPSNNGPDFIQSRYNAEVSENKPTSTSVVQVTARYASSAVASTNIAYYLTGITASGISVSRLFQVQPTTGSIATTATLDRETGFTEYILDIYAIDQDSASPKTTKTQVFVTVLDENDSAPVFIPPSYRQTVSESAVPGYVALRVVANDADTNSAVQYAIVGGDDGDNFRIDAFSGEISIQKSLDRERASEYRLEIRATDGVQSSTAVARITVTDVNDELPMFHAPWYAFSILEDARTGTTVGRVMAEDKDSEADNKEISYSVVSHWGRGKFSLHSHTGVFTLTDNLDYETANHYILTVRAQDSGVDSKSSTVLVYMNVLDINNNAPVFDPSSYSNEVWENATVGTSILMVSTTDIDNGVNSEVKYSITGGDTEGRFTIGPLDGVIRTALPLDREVEATYNLAISATDLAVLEVDRLTTSAMVTIKLKDNNDNSPVFTTPDAITISEGTQTGAAVYTFHATDTDSGRNGEVEYSLSGADRRYFSVTPAGGILSVTGSLDRETRSEYVIEVNARDKGSPSRTTVQEVKVTVGDSNDHSPVFNPRDYSKEVREDEPVGSLLLTVTATDMDIGLNGDVRYVIRAGDANQDLWLDSHLGKLYINKKLDYERKTEYVLQVVAQDLGSAEQRTDTASVTISVTDVNDNAPEFLDPPLVTYVEEDQTALPVYITTVRTRDRDSTPNSGVTYTMVDGDRSLFGVDASSGVVSLLKSLDREAQDLYTVVVRATDSGSPRQTSTGTLTVIVTDTNDNAPAFQHSSYATYISENEPAHSTVLQLTATDSDVGRNALIRYSLVEDGDGRFTIDTASGSVTTTTKLDRELEDNYQLVVMATDDALLSRSAVVTFDVHVDDVNDNAPHFLQRQYNVFIREPTNQGGFVLGVTAIDADLAENGQITYTLSGADASSFNIDSTTGIITARTTLVGRPAGYTFAVKATDNGDGQKSDEVPVQVNFLSPGTSGFPSFQPGTLPVTRISENTPVDTPIATVSASSPRSGVTLTYDLVGGNVGHVFRISQSGQVKIRSALDREAVPVYGLWIEVRDSGTPSLASVIQLRVELLDENDNVPRFDSVFYNVSISEEEWPPMRVTQVTAADPDSGENGRVTYSIAGGNEAGYFDIDTASGTIETMMKMDREVQDKYALEIHAVDHGATARTATTIVDITVLDKNDQPPKFTHIFSAQIPESAPLGSFVVRVTSTDADIGSNALPTYSLMGDNDGKFAIDPETGEVTVAAPLDYEASQEYLLGVAANDGAYRAQTTVTIDVLDINDNAPVFAQPEYRFTVMEDQDEGYSVGTVSASDNDADGPNAQFFYRLKDPSDLFTVDGSSGEVTTLVTLTFNSDSGALSPDNTHYVTILALDRGEPPMSSEVGVTIEIKPANQEAPVFEEDAYWSAVAEDVAIGTSVITVTAVDPDDEGAVEYRTTSGNGTVLFTLDGQTGLITVASGLDGHRGRIYTLNVQARDAGLPVKTSTTSVYIRVAPVNRNAPQFSANQAFSAEIPESQFIGASVGRATASDADGDRVEYFISNSAPIESMLLFEINQSSGMITIAEPLDFETTPIHQLTVTARDSTTIPRETSRLFTVYVTDVNDNAPQFTEDVYNIDVPENTLPGTSITQLRTSDADSVSNSIVEYYMTGDLNAMDIFSVNSATGVITAQGEIDYESGAEYKIEVKAQNPGTQLSSTATVLVHVTGVNEFKPDFHDDEYTFTIREDQQPGSSIGGVTATDADRGADGIVYYYLAGDSNLQSFTINERTGDIIMNAQVDREAVSELRLRVLAVNRGPLTGNNTAMVTVRILVRDANDPPLFTERLYDGAVRENSEIGTSVLKVSAIDSDEQAENRRFTYRIAAGGSDGNFRIDSATGWITTNTQLDREEQPAHSFTVVAIDRGSPPRTGTTSVKIQVNDVNDNAPYFEPTVPIGHLTENQDPFSQIAIDLAALTEDDDLPPNQNPFSYQLVDKTNIFEIGENSGVIRARVELDRERVPTHVVRVRVMDGGDPTMTSTLTVKVEVKDINDNPSEERMVAVTTYVVENEFNGAVIADLHPNDLDLEGQYRCSLTSQPGSFSISESCDLYASRVTSSTSDLDLLGSDGIHDEVRVEAKVNFVELPESAFERTVVMRIGNVEISEFLSTYYTNMRNAITKFLPSGSTLYMYSIRQQPVSNNILVYATAKQASGIYTDHNVLLNTIQAQSTQLERSLQLDIMDVHYDPCAQNVCQNNGECTSMLDVISDDMHLADSPEIIISSPKVELKVTCLCQEDYTGALCENPLNQCEGTPCKNGGLCTHQRGSSFDCLCPENWTGPTCEEDVDECDRGVCRNGGTCANTPGSYRCECTASYTGKDCGESVNFCQSGENPCQNNGLCIPRSAGYSCKCAFGYHGDHCQFKSKGFGALSFAEYIITLDSSKNTIEMEFATLRRNSLLLYNAASGRDKDEFISMEIIEGHVRFSFALGAGTITRLTIPVDVADGMWHRIDAEREGKVGTLKVTSCTAGPETCKSCQQGDSGCYKKVEQGDFQVLELSSTTLTIGGVNDINTILNRPGQVQTHDFVGCLRSLRVDGIDLLWGQPASQEHKVTTGCQRTTNDGQCGGSNVCVAEAQCVDRWDHATCVCAEGKTGPKCDKDISSGFSFGPQSIVSYTVKPSYERDLKLADNAARRRKRSIIPDKHISTVSIRLRTMKNTGVVYYAGESDDYIVIQITEGNAEFKRESALFPTSLVSSRVNDGSWHNLTLTVTMDAVAMDVDGNKGTSDLGFSPRMLGVTNMALGGVPSDVSQDKTGFEGCISEVRLNGSPLPFSGETDQFTIEATGGVNSSCPDVLPVVESGGLRVGIIIIIVFFAVVMVVIISVFVVCWYRRSRGYKNTGFAFWTKKPHLNGDVISKSNGGIMDKTGKDSRSQQDSGYTENNDLSEEAIIQDHVARQLATGVYQERLVSADGTVGHPGGGGPRPRAPLPSNKPDLVAPGESPDMFRDNQAYIDEPPEHYDIENASSIAPSDLVDVVAHYNRYRKGLPLTGKGHHRHPHRHSPSNFLAMNQPISENPMRRSPAHMLESTPYNRSSPMPAQQSPLTISPLTINNVNKLNRAQSPLVRESPLNQLSRSTPTAHLRGHATSPIPPGSLRSTPINGLYAPPSNHSNSSTSYTEKPNIPVTGINGHGRPGGSRPNSRMQQPLNHLGLRSTPTRGLSLEEVEALNQRPGPTPPSTLDAISSSTDQPQPGRNNLNRPSLPARRPPPVAPLPAHAHHHLGDPLDPAETSSESGSNDSFTCSEFESESDNKIRNDLNSRLKYARAPTETEPEDTDVSRTLTKSPTDSNRDSLSAFFTSEDELPKPTNKLLNGALNLDYLLNWGPNFSKLVGVFQDIAQLPDTHQPIQLGGHILSTPTKSPLDSRMTSPHQRTVSPLSARPPSRTKSPHRTKSPLGRTTSPIGRTTSPLGLPNSSIGRATSPLGRTTSPVIARNASPMGRTVSPLHMRPPSRQQQQPARPPSVLKMQPPPSPLPHPGVSPIPHLVADSQGVTLDSSLSPRTDGSRSPLHDSVQDSREEYV